VQREVIIGTLLGDGSMRCKTNALLEINHTVHQKEYVDWKYRYLSELVRTPPKARNGNQGRIAYRFVTRSLAELTPFYRLFYEDGRKVIPEVALTPLTLAVWFMDDGCKSRSAVYLNTQQFNSDGQTLLLEMLRNQWSIDGSVNRDKIYYRIRISVKGTVKLVNLIEPYVIPELRYKLPQVTP
jgi:hypothetical protein